VSGGGDGTLKLWDLASGAQLDSLSVDEELAGSTISSAKDGAGGGKPDLTVTCFALNRKTNAGVAAIHSSASVATQLVAFRIESASTSKNVGGDCNYVIVSEGLIDLPKTVHTTITSMSFDEASSRIWLAAGFGKSATTFVIVGGDCGHSFKSLVLREVSAPQQQLCGEDQEGAPFVPNDRAAPLDAYAHLRIKSVDQVSRHDR